MKTAETIKAAFLETAENYKKLTDFADLIEQAAAETATRLQKGGIAFFCGNGGSASDAQHLAGELQGRFLKERSPLSAMALTANTATLTAIGNDYGYDEVFSRQLKGFPSDQHILVALSTSGNSKNVIEALKVAKSLNQFTIGLTGDTGGAMKDLCDICFTVPSSSTPRIQEMHIGVGHMMCQLIEDIVF